MALDTHVFPKHVASGSELLKLILETVFVTCLYTMQPTFYGDLGTQKDGTAIVSMENLRCNILSFSDHLELLFVFKI